MEETGFPDVSSSFRKQTTKRPRILVFLIVFLVLLGALVFAGSRYLNSQEEQLAPTSAPTQAPTEAPTPTAEVSGSPTPETSPTGGTTPSVTPKTTGAADAAKADLSIQVLNGSGVSGAAGKMSSTLQGLGYAVSSTGNADSFDYEDITIQGKSTKNKAIQTLKTDLSKTYTVTKTTTDLPASSPFDVVVIVGK
jgi:hypothetical protein